MMLTRKLEETKMTEFQAPNNVQVVDEPTLPEGFSSPRLKLGLLLAILFGLLGSSGYVVYKELMYKTVRGVEIIKHVLELPVLGIVPDENVVALEIEVAQQPKEPTWYDKLKEFIWKK